MNDNFRQRPLNFEQMEERLALSTTSGGEYFSGLISLSTTQGGIISLEQAFVMDGNGKTHGTVNAGAVSELGVSRFEHFYLYDSDSVFGEYLDRGAVTTNIAPIAQPQMGTGDTAQGLVSIAEIFRPTTVTASSEEKLVRVEPVVETIRQDTELQGALPFTVARGRDVYFDVVGQPAKEIVRTSLFDGLSSEQALPDSAEKPAITQEDADPAVDAKSMDSSAETSINSREAGATVARHSLADEETPIKIKDDAVKDRNSEASSSHLTEAKLSELTSRDQVLTDWRRDELLVDEAILLRTKEPEEQTAAWPALVALVGSGWWVRSRLLVTGSVFKPRSAKKKQV
jgi:hypothetical protein